MRDLWMAVEMDKDPNAFVLDCGYSEDQDARDRADRVFEFGVGRNNLSLELSPARIYISIPKSKRASLLTAFPDIKAGKVHWGSTHHFEALRTPQEEK